MKKLRIMFIAVLAFVAQPALADWMGLGVGRSANLDNATNMSIDGGIVFGGDIKLYGGRFNFKASPDLLVFGDVALRDESGFASGDGLVFGGGAIYQMRNVQLLENTDFAIRGVFHTGSLDCGGNCNVDIREMGVTALISGDQLSDTDFGWYANAGFSNISFDIGTFFGGNVSSTEIVLGGGVTGTLGFGEWYAGIDLIDSILFSAGVRYNLN